MSNFWDRRHYTNRSADEVQRWGQESGYQGPNSQYGFAGNNGWTWYDNAGANWSNNHYIDPNTGAIRSKDGSPVGAPPSQAALQWQSAHEQAVWDIRNRLSQSAAKYGQGGLHLMQSFRPGGGATIEANTYGQMAGIQLQRASMMEPMDYLSDYRRQAGQDQARAARRAQERQTYIGAGIAVASVVAGALTGGAGGALLAGAGAAYMNSQKQQSAASTINPDAQYPSENSYQNRQLSQFRQDMNPNGGSIWNSTDPNPYNREQAGPQAGGGGGGSYAAGLQQEGAAGGGRRPEQQQAPGGQLAGGGGGGAPGGGKAGPGGPQAGGGGMGGSPFQSPGVGIDGNFTPTAYAANAAMQSNPVMQTYLLKQVADASDNDPFYDAFSMTVDRQMVARMGAA